MLFHQSNKSAIRFWQILCAIHLAWKGKAAMKSWENVFAIQPGETRKCAGDGKVILKVPSKTKRIAYLNLLEYILKISNFQSLH